MTPHEEAESCKYEPPWRTMEQMHEYHQIKYGRGIMTHEGRKEQLSNHPLKADAVLQAIRSADVGSDVVIHNEDGSVFCILTVKVKEHPEHHRSGARCSVHKWDSLNLWCEVCGHQKQRR